MIDAKSEQFVGQYPPQKISRRDFLREVALLAGGAVTLAACGGELPENSVASNQQGTKEPTRVPLNIDLLGVDASDPKVWTKRILKERQENPHIDESGSIYLNGAVALMEGSKVYYLPGVNEVETFPPEGVFTTEAKRHNVIFEVGPDDQKIIINPLCIVFGEEPEFGKPMTNVDGSLTSEYDVVSNSVWFAFPVDKSISPLGVAFVPYSPHVVVYPRDGKGEAFVENIPEGSLVHAMRMVDGRPYDPKTDGKKSTPWDTDAAFLNGEGNAFQLKTGITFPWENGKDAQQVYSKICNVDSIVSGLTPIK